MLIKINLYSFPSLYLTFWSYFRHFFSVLALHIFDFSILINSYLPSFSCFQKILHNPSEPYSLFRRLLTCPKEIQQIYVVGYDEEASISDLSQNCCEICKSRVSVCSIIRTGRSMFIWPGLWAQTRSHPYSIWDEQSSSPVDSKRQTG